jgi:hypothetical protein
MKLKIISLAAIGALLLIGAGCAGRALIGQVKTPGAEVAAPAGNVDKAVDDIFKDETATTDAISDESADSAEITADQADVNSVQDTSYETE